MQTVIETWKYGDIEVYVTPIVRHEGDAPGVASRQAVQELLACAIAPDAMLCHHPSGAPYIYGDSRSISVSHCRSHAAIALSNTHIVGIDIENWREQLVRVAPRILSAEELTIYASPGLLLRSWTLKEALYKAALSSGIDFRKDIRLPMPPASQTAAVAGHQYRVDAVIERADYTMSLVSRYMD